MKRIKKTADVTVDTVDASSFRLPSLASSANSSKRLESPQLALHVDNSTASVINVRRESEEFKRLLANATRTGRPEAWSAVLRWMDQWATQSLDFDPEISYQVLSLISNTATPQTVVRTFQRSFPEIVGYGNCFDDPGRLKMGDLIQAVPSVIEDVQQQAAMWTRPLTQKPLCQHRESSLLDPILVPPISDLLRQPKLKRKSLKSIRKQQITGIELVESLLSGNLSKLGITVPVYLQQKGHQHGNYYDLVLTNQKPFDEEYFMLSKSVMSHVTFSRIEESLLLKDWHREATLYTQLRRIPFIKSFVLRKAFVRWKLVLKKSQFDQRVQQMRDVYLMSHPLIAFAIAEVRKLLYSLRNWEFIRIEKDYCYSMDELTDVVDKSLFVCYKTLNNVLGTIHNLLKETGRKSMQWLQELQYVKRNLVQYSGVGIYEEAKRRRVLEQKLRDADQQVMSLGRFITFLGRMMKIELRDITREAVSWYWDDVSSHSKEIGLVQVTFIFRETDEIVLSSPLEDIVFIVTKPTLKFQEFVCKLAEDEDITVFDLPELYYGHNQEAMTAIADDLQTMEKPEDLVVIGQHIMGEIRPIVRHEIRNCLESDPVLNELLSRQLQLVKKAVREVQYFARSNAWLSEINRFVRTWKESDLKNLKRTPVELQKVCYKINSWMTAVSKLSPIVSSTCHIVSVDCEPLKSGLISQLQPIMQQLMKGAREELDRVYLLVNSKVVEWFQSLQVPDIDTIDLISFVEYAKLLQRAKLERVVINDMIKGLEQLFELMVYLFENEHEEEKRRLSNNWSTFLLALQNGTAFVDSCAHEMSKEVLKNYESAKGSMFELFKTFETQWYNDPASGSDEVLVTLDKMKRNCLSIQHRMREISECHFVLTGKECDMTALDQAFYSIETLRDIWHSYLFTQQTVATWKATPFYKMDITNALFLLSKWDLQTRNFQRMVSSHLKLPESAFVFTEWCAIISNMVKPFSILQEMASSCLKSRHWKALSVTFALDTELTSFTSIGSLLDADLSTHADTIASICSEATRADAFEQSFNRMQQVWDQMEFRISKQILLKGSMSSVEKQYGQDYVPMPVAFVVVGIEELKNRLEDNSISLQLVLSSSLVTDDVKVQAQYLLGTLQDAGRLLDFLTTCQDKWLHLRTLFCKPEVRKSLSRQSIDLHKVIDLQFYDIMKDLLDANRVIVAVGRKQIASESASKEAAYRIVHSLTSCIANEKKLLSQLSSYVDHLCEQFPRNYFLNYESIVELGVACHNHKHLISLVNGVYRNVYSFKIVESVATDLVTGTGCVYHITHICGAAGEKVALETTVATNVDAHICLSRLGDSIVSTLSRLMEDCCASCPECVNDDNMKQWIETYPSQCILAALGVHSTEKISQSLDVADKTSKNMKTWIDAVLASCIAMLNEKREGGLCRRSLLVLEGMAITGRHLQDITNRLFNANVTKSSYEWQQQFHHRLVPVSGEDKSMNYEIELLDHTSMYSYEYIGPQHQIVLTPLTDRCFQSLALAASSFTCGTLMGAPATGRTTMIQQLSYMFARPFISLLCSPDLHPSYFSRLFVGAVQCGGWLAFVSPHQLQSSVMTMLSQLITTACSAVAAMFYDRKTPHPGIRKHSELHVQDDTDVSSATCPTDLENELDAASGVKTDSRSSDVGVVFQINLQRRDPGFACFVCDDPIFLKVHQLSDFMQAVMRVVSFPSPCNKAICFVYMWMGGFSESLLLARKLSALPSKLADKCPRAKMDLRRVIRILRSAVMKKRRHQTRRPMYAVDDKNFLHQAIIETLCPSLSEVDSLTVTDIVNKTFPFSTTPVADEEDGKIAVLRTEIIEELNRNKLDATKLIVDKIVHLYNSINTNGGTLLVGPCGAGKSTCCRILSEVLKRLSAMTSPSTLLEENHLTRMQEMYFSSVDVFTIFPQAMEQNEIFGSMDPIGHCWKDAVIPRLLRDASRSSQSSSVGTKWLVFDGVLSSSYTEILGRISNQTVPLSLANGEQIYLADSVKMVAELSCLDHLSPDLGRFGMVWIGGSVVGWKSVCHSWMDSSCKKWDTEVVRLLSSLCDYVIKPTLTFVFNQLSSSSTEFLSQFSANQVTLLMKFLTALFDFHYCVKKQRDLVMRLSDNDRATFVAGLFAVAYVWAFASNLQQSHLAKFDEFTRETFANCPIPVDFPKSGTVFDYHFDLKHGSLVAWPDEGIMDSGLLCIPEVSRYVKWIEKLVACGENVLLIGESGVGTSSFIQIVKSLKPNYEIASLPVTPNMTVRDIRGQLVSCLQPEKRRFMNLDYRSRHAIFVDDFSIQTGQDDANLGDVIRQAMCSGTVLGVDGLSMVSAAGIQFILSAYPPPSWSTRDRDNQHFVNSRLRRMLCILNVYPHGLETLTHMLVPRFLKWLEGYPSLSDSKSLAKAFAFASARIHAAVCTLFPQTDDCPHYLWTQRTLMQLTDNLVCLSSLNQTNRMLPLAYTRRSSSTASDIRSQSGHDRMRHRKLRGSSRENEEFSEAKRLIHFWYNEVIRVYCDRLTTTREANQLQASVRQIMKDVFTSSESMSSSQTSDPLPTGFIGFRDIISIMQGFAESMYAPCFDAFVDDGQDMYKLQSMTDIMKYCQEAVNLYSVVQEETQQTNIILFSEAIEHIVRLFRSLLLPCGHAILIGHWFTCRRTMAKVATQGIRCKTVEVNQVELGRERIRDACRIAGVEKEVCCLIFQSHVSRYFLSEAYCLMQHGYIDGLFSASELQFFKADFTMLRSGAKVDRKPNHNIFWGNVKQYLHVIVCMPFHDDDVTKWLLKVPKLLSVASTIDYYCTWSKEVLTEVAHTHLQQSLGDSVPWSVKKTSMLNISEFLAHIHSCVMNELSPQTARALTPATFIEFIDIFIAITHRFTKQQKGILKLMQDLAFRTNDVQSRCKVVSQDLICLKEKFSKAEEIYRESCQLVESMQLDANRQYENYLNEDKKLADEKNEVELLKNEGQMKYDEVTPLYAAALKSLTVLDKRHVDELKTYIMPPQAVCDVCGAVCLLFGLPSDSWEEARMLLSSKGFFQNLVYFNKESVSVSKLRALCKLTTSASFNLGTLHQVSQAAAALCRWVKAVEMYVTVYRDIEPLRQRVAKAESMIARKEATLIDVQKQLLEQQNELKEMISQKDKAASMNKELKEEIETNEVLLKHIQHLQSCLDNEQMTWLTTIKQCKTDIAACPGSAALAAASVVYLGRVPLEEREKWLDTLAKFAQSRGSSLCIPINRELSLQKLLASHRELVLWERDQYPTDKESVANILLLKCCLRYGKHMWPLIIDLHGVAVDWIMSVVSSNDQQQEPERTCFVSVSACANNLDATIETARDKGQTVIIKDVETVTSSRILSLTRRHHGSCHPNFQVCFIAGIPLQLLLELNWQVNFTCLICLVMPTNTLVERILLATAAELWPEYSAQEETLLRELVHYRQQLKDAKDIVTQLVAKVDGNLIESTEIVHEAVQKSMAQQVESQEHLDITAQLLEEKKRQLQEYKPLAIRMACFYQGLRRLAQVFPVYSCLLQEFISIYSKMVFSGCDPKASSWTRETEISRLVVSVGRSVYARLAHRMVGEHHLILAFLIVLEILITSSKINHHDIELFFASGDDSTTVSSNLRKPKWISEKQWQALHFVQHHRDLPWLCSELADQSKQWEEYFQLEPVMLCPENTPIATGQTHLKPIHCLVLWSIIKPERLASACQRFVIDNLGPDFVDPQKHDLKGLLNSAKHNQLVLLIHKDEEMRETIKCMSEICQSSKDKKLSALQVVIVADENGVDSAVEMIKQNRNSGECLLINMCFWNNCWPDKLVTAIAETTSSSSEHEFRICLMVKYSVEMPVCLKSPSPMLIGCSQSVKQTEVNANAHLDNQQSFCNVLQRLLIGYRKRQDI